MKEKEKIAFVRLRVPDRPPDWTLEFKIGDKTEPEVFNFWFFKDPSQEGDD